MALTIVALGTLLFVGAHLLPMFPSHRDALVSRLGENAYRGVFSLVTLIGLIGAIVAYRYTPHTFLWSTPAPLQALAVLLMLLSVICFAAAKGVPWFKRVVRHPMLWGIGLFGLAHLLANGEVAGVILFGGLTVFGFLWQPMTDRRDAAQDPEGWARTEATTSLIPFARWGALGAEAPAVTWRPLVMGVVVFVALLLLHPLLFGVAAIPR